MLRIIKNIRAKRYEYIADGAGMFSEDRRLSAYIWNNGDVSLLLTDKPVGEAGGPYFILSAKDAKMLIDAYLKKKYVSILPFGNEKEGVE